MPTGYTHFFGSEAQLWEAFLVCRKQLKRTFLNACTATLAIIFITTHERADKTAKTVWQGKKTPFPQKNRTAGAKNAPGSARNRQSYGEAGSLSGFGEDKKFAIVVLRYNKI